MTLLPHFSLIIIINLLFSFQRQFISPLLTAHLNNNYYSENKFKAVQEVVVAPSLVQGARILLLTCGVGKLRPNLLGFGFREAFIDVQETKLTFDYVQAIRDALRLNFSVAILRNYVHERVGAREKAVDAVDTLSSRNSNLDADLATGGKKDTLGDLPMGHDEDNDGKHSPPPEVSKFKIATLFRKM